MQQSILVLTFIYYVIFLTITRIEFLDVKLYFMGALAGKISCRRFKKKT